MITRKLELRKEIKNLTNTIAMKCLDCVCCQPKEILRCEIEDCPLWDKRPKELRGLYILIKKLRQININFYEANN